MKLSRKQLTKLAKEACKISKFKYELDYITTSENNQGDIAVYKEHYLLHKFNNNEVINIINN